MLEYLKAFRFWKIGILGAKIKKKPLDLNRINLRILSEQTIQSRNVPKNVITTRNSITEFLP
jgi:hypothetical protein